MGGKLWRKWWKLWRWRFSILWQFRQQFWIKSRLVKWVLQLKSRMVKWVLKLKSRVVNYRPGGSSSSYRPSGSSSYRPGNSPNLSNILNGSIRNGNTGDKNKDKDAVVFSDA